MAKIKEKSVTANQTGDIEWTITDEDGSPRYKIVPYQNHLCYNLFEWGVTTNRKTGEETWGWKDTGYYPSDLALACNVVRDRLIMASGVHTKDMVELKKVITRSTTQILNAVKEGFAQWTT